VRARNYFEARARHLLAAARDSVAVVEREERLAPPVLSDELAEAKAEPLDGEAERAAIRAEPPLPAPDTPERERLDATQRRTVAGLLNAALMRPTSWAQPDRPPPPGAWCSCCRGRTWWRERDAPRGWRCWLCHPAPRGHPAVITFDT
jgi:hypothetical protein